MPNNNKQNTHKDDTLFACEPVIILANDSLMLFIHMSFPELYHHLSNPSTNLAIYSQQVVTDNPGLQYDVTFIRRRALSLAAKNSGLSDPDLVADQCMTHFLYHRSVHCSAHFYEGALDALQQLRLAGFRIATISNGNANVRLISELSPLVEVHVSAAEAKNAKPHAAPFLLLAERLQVSPSAILHVGDDYRADVLGALNAGYAYTAWVSNSAENQDHQAHIVIQSVKDLVPHLTLNNDNTE